MRILNGGIVRSSRTGNLFINTNRSLGMTRMKWGLIINPTEAEIVKRIFEEYLAGNGVFKIAKLLNAEGVPTVTGSKWCESSILEILKNEKYKGDAILQKYHTPNHLTKQKKRNIGELDSYYIEDNHLANCFKGNMGAGSG